jgi:cyclohexyl-isocyanide hydratase
MEGRSRLSANRNRHPASPARRACVYAPEPPFDSGTPETAPSPILEQARRSARAITVQREQTARRIAAKLGIAIPAAGGE